MIRYKFKHVSPYRSRIYRGVMDLMGNCIETTYVEFDWDCAKLGTPSDKGNYYERIYFNITKW